jgi:hypothetical protein
MCKSGSRWLTTSAALSWRYAPGWRRGLILFEGQAVAGTETEELRLDVRQFTDLTSWRWELTGGAGRLIAVHQVRLDAASWQFEAFTDLAGYLSWHVAFDRRREDEARIVAEVGDWIAEQVLGSVGPALLARRPVTVRVVVPAAAGGLLAARLSWPGSAALRCRCKTSPWLWTRPRL